MIFTVLLRDGIDRKLARRIALWISRYSTEAEFYVWGDDAHR